MFLKVRVFFVKTLENHNILIDTHLKTPVQNLLLLRKKKIRNY